MQVTQEEVVYDLRDIEDSKSPGCDGMNAFFFKRTWGVIGKDVTTAVLKFFAIGKMFPPINCTTVTLIPKVKHPSTVKEYRPISYCTVLYKLISKILTKRLQPMMDALVDGCQAAFVPGRNITDNIILSHELVKSYGRKAVSPRCMLKHDMQKAYNSLEWGFLEQVLRGLAIPEQFVRWLMSCISTMSYSILINGSPSRPFVVKKWLRQGDPLSPYLFVLAMEYLKRGDTSSVKLLYEVFVQFRKASGLAVNARKSSVFFGGVVPPMVKTEILQLIEFLEGSLPVRYLGVPLSIKRLSITQCRPLIDKMVSKISSWTSKMLSYAGRLQLVKSVLMAMQSYWSQIFILPKKIIKLVKAMCRSFLWSGGNDINKKALMAWSNVCEPRTTSGFNIMDLHLWNKAAVYKHLLNLCRKKDKLWIQWVHMYYIKGAQLWEVQVKQPSWMVRKILKARETCAQAGLDYNWLASKQSFSIKELYTKTREQFQKVRWRRVVCNNLSSPKWIFNLTLVANGRIYTRDRPAKWGVTRETVFPLCDTEKETIDHCFLDVSLLGYSGQRCCIGKELIGNQCAGMMNSNGLSTMPLRRLARLNCIGWY